MLHPPASHRALSSRRAARHRRAQSAPWGRDPSHGGRGCGPEAASRRQWRPGRHLAQGRRLRAPPPAAGRRRRHLPLGTVVARVRPGRAAGLAGAAELLAGLRTSLAVGRVRQLVVGFRRRCLPASGCATISRPADAIDPTGIPSAVPPAAPRRDPKRRCRAPQRPRPRSAGNRSRPSNERGSRCRRA